MHILFMLIDWFEEKSLHYFSKHKWKKFFSLLVHLFVWASFKKTKIECIQNKLNKKKKK